MTEQKISYSINSLDEFTNVFGIYPRETYLNGQCHLFAVAAHILTNLPICAFLENRAINWTNGIVQGRGLIHAFIVPYADKHEIFDANGIREIDDLKNEYCLHPDCWVEFITMDDLLLFGEIEHIGSDAVTHALKKTIRYIEAMFEDELKVMKEKGRKTCRGGHS